MKPVLFSKGLQHLPVARAAEQAAALGFAGLDLTVRPNGHVKPEAVGQDLPRAAKAIRAAGLELSMLTTEIKHPGDPTAEAIYAAAADCGVRFLKFGYLAYTYGSYRELVSTLQREAPAFEALGRKYDVCGCHHIHSGDIITQSAITLAQVLADVDPRYVAAYIDPCHMVIEGGLQGWLMGMDALGDRIRLVAIKDFRWPAEPARKREGYDNPAFVPLRAGTVPWHQVLRVLTRQGYDGLFSYHMEYTGLEKEPALRAVSDDKAYIAEVLKDLRAEVKV